MGVRGGGGAGEGWRMWQSDGELKQRRAVGRWGQLTVVTKKRINSSITNTISSILFQLITFNIYIIYLKFFATNLNLKSIFWDTGEENFGESGCRCCTNCTRLSVTKLWAHLGFGSETSHTPSKNQLWPDPNTAGWKADRAATVL